VRFAASIEDEPDMPRRLVGFAARDGLDERGVTGFSRGDGPAPVGGRRSSREHRSI
jgi:hypothetical protein